MSIEPDILPLSLSLSIDFFFFRGFTSSACLDQVPLGLVPRRRSWPVTDISLKIPNAAGGADRQTYAVPAVSRTSEKSLVGREMRAGQVLATVSLVCGRPGCDAFWLMFFAFFFSLLGGVAGADKSSEAIQTSSGRVQRAVRCKSDAAEG